MPVGRVQEHKYWRVEQVIRHFQILSAIRKLLGWKAKRSEENYFLPRLSEREQRFP